MKQVILLLHILISRNRMQKCSVIFISVILFGCNQPEPNYYANCNVESLYDLKYLENVDSITSLHIVTTDSKLIPIILKSIGKTKVKYLSVFTDSLILNENIEIQGLVDLYITAMRYAEMNGSIRSSSLKNIIFYKLNEDGSNFLKDQKLRTIQLFCDSNGIPGMISSVSSVDYIRVDGDFTSEVDLSSIKNVESVIQITNHNKNVHLSLEKVKKILLKNNSPDVSIYLDREIE